MLPATAINGIVAKCFMAAQKIQKCFIYQIVMGIIMIVFVFSFIKIKGSFGYPLALSVFWWVNVLTLFIIMKDNFPQIQYMGAVCNACHIIFYVLPVVVPLYFIKMYFLSEHLWVSCIVGVVGFIGVLLLVIRNNYPDEIGRFSDKIRKLYVTFIGNKL
jgi:peptidoglycan biosynthesis protein MviN/MurJ (putative lipid II flippase)